MKACTNNCEWQCTCATPQSETGKLRAQLEEAKRVSFDPKVLEQMNELDMENRHLLEELAAAQAELAEVQDKWLSEQRTNMELSAEFEELAAELAALKAGSGEPVARCIDDGTEEGGVEWIVRTGKPIHVGDLLYAAPPKAEPSGEAVGVFANVNSLTPENGERWEHMTDESFDGVDYIYLYTAPPTANEIRAQAMEDAADICTKYHDKKYNAKGCSLVLRAEAKKLREKA